MSAHRQQQLSLPLGLVEGGELVDGRHVYLHGNYEHYYGDKGWRTTGGSESSLDGRLAAVWEYDCDMFSGRRVLDVGCNRGVIAVAVAGAFNAANVVGVDVDVKLIDSAVQTVRSLKALQRIRRSRRSGTAAACSTINAQRSTLVDSVGMKSDAPPNSDNQNCMEDKKDTHVVSVCTGTGPYKQKFEDNSISRRSDVDEDDWEQLPMHLKGLACCLPSKNPKYFDYGFPNNLEFRAENFVLDSVDLRRSKELHNWTPFDVVLLFSVTKWVHYHQGDVGVKRMFHTAHKLLKPGGFMILEPQSWEAYRKKRRLREDIKQRVMRTLLKPHLFSQYLTEARVQHTSNSSGSSGTAAAEGVVSGDSLAAGTGKELAAYGSTCTAAAGAVTKDSSTCTDVVGGAQLSADCTTVGSVVAGGSFGAQPESSRREWLNDDVDEKGYCCGRPLFELLTVLHPLRPSGATACAATATSAATSATTVGTATSSNTSGDGGSANSSGVVKLGATTFDRPVFIYKKIL